MHDGRSELAALHHEDGQQPDPLLTAQAEAPVHGAARPLFWLEDTNC